MSSGSLPDDPTAEVTDLLRTLVRNGCVNDGTEASGGEVRSADTISSYLGGSGLDLQHFEPRPGRRSLLARIEGTDPTAPTLLLMGHTDVVPVNLDGWSRDPFAADLDDGMVWGRGAVDMLNLTASMAVAFRHLADSGFRPRGTLAYLAVADEEALGTWGADWLTDHELDHVRADYVVTESGGFQMPVAGGVRLPVMVEEKGTYWTKITVHGTPGHGSSPYGTDNALVTAAEVVRRVSSYRPPARLSQVWERFVEGMELPPTCSNRRAWRRVVDQLRWAWRASCTRRRTPRSLPPSPHGGTKRRDPDRVELEVDGRTLPVNRGTRPGACCSTPSATGRPPRHHVERRPAHVVGGRHAAVDSLARTTARLCEGSALVPMIMVGGTDNRFFRRAGAVGYGFGLFSRRLEFGDYATMFHGNDERVDVDSLRLSTELWTALAHDLLG